MTKEEVIEKLIEQVNHNMDTFIGILGILLAAFLYFQWRLSQSQLNKLKEEIEKQIRVKYHLDKINKIEQIDNTLIRLALTNLRSVTNRMLFDSESYTNVSLTDKAINIIGYLSVLKNQEIKSADFIKEIGSVFMMIDGWCNRSTKNSLGSIDLTHGLRKSLGNICASSNTITLLTMLCSLRLRLTLLVKRDSKNCTLVVTIIGASQFSVANL